MGSWSLRNRVLGDIETKAPPATTPPNVIQPIIKGKVLVIIPDNKLWYADRHHQKLTNKLLLDDYRVAFATYTATTRTITSFNPSIILVYEANKIEKTEDKQLIALHLCQFMSSGGAVIFGGVPWGFNGVDNPSANDVFKSVFNVDWMVASQRVVKPSIAQIHKMILERTWLVNVPSHARLHPPYCQFPRDACARVLQPYGSGVIGYIGNHNLYNKESLKWLRDMCQKAMEMTVMPRWLATGSMTRD